MTMIKSIVFILLIMPVSVIIAQKAQGGTTPQTQSSKGTYDSIIYKADSAIFKEEFYKAKEYYEQAIVLQPENSYPVQMLKNAENAIRSIEERKAHELDIKRKAEVSRLMTEASKEIFDKNYDSALVLYIRILSLNPIKSQEEFAKQKIKAIDRALGKSSQIPAAPLTKEVPLKVQATNAGTPVLTTGQTNLTAAVKDIPALAINKNENTNIKPYPESAKDGTKSFKLAQKADTIKRQELLQNKGDIPKPELQEARKKAIEKKETEEALPAIKTSVNEKAVNPYTSNTTKATTGLTNTGKANITGEKDKRLLNAAIDSAQLAVKNEDYKQAHIFFEEVIRLSTTRTEKEFAQTALKAVDEQLKNDREKAAKGKP